MNDFPQLDLPSIPVNLFTLEKVPPIYLKLLIPCLFGMQHRRFGLN